MTVHGTARFASRAELRAAGLLADPGSGAPPDGLMLGWWYENRHDFQPLAYGGDLHQLIVGGTGGGKFTTAIAPLLLGSGLDAQTVVVVDPKGEIAQLAGPFFQEAFAPEPSVFLLDPWDECKTGQTSVLNPLASLTLDNPNYVDDARALADAMIIQSGGDNTHWDNTARNFLAAVLLYVALDPLEEGMRDLIRVRELITLPYAMPKSYKGPKRQTLSALIHSFMESELAGGAIRRGFQGLVNRGEKERPGVISGIERDTTWMDSPQMAKVLRGPTLDMKKAALGGGKYFVVLPPQFFMTHRGWLRLSVATFSNAFKRYRPDASLPQHKRWRHIIIDEFANLGEMTVVLQDVPVARGFDTKYHLSTQDLASIKRVYQDGWESFINNSFQRFFAVSDLFTADYVSRLLGAATVASESFTSGSSTSRGTSRSVTEGSSAGKSLSDSYGKLQSGETKGVSFSTSESTSDSTGWSESRSVGQVQRSLRTPDEVRRLDEGSQFLFMRGLHPVECWRPPYWEIFPSLPSFDLKQILGTIGRMPENEAERQYFILWREAPLLMQPDARPAPPLALPPPAPQPLPAPASLRIKLALALAALVALCAVAYPVISYFRSPPPEPVIAVAPPAPPLMPKPEPPPPPPPAAPMAPAATVSAPVKTRPPVPNLATIEAMPRGATTRDYLLNLVRENIHRCTPGRGSAEQFLIEYLFSRTRSKYDLNIPMDAARQQLAARYAETFDAYRRKPTWTRAERDEIMELMLRASRDQLTQGGVYIGMIAAFNRFYQGGGCPFDTVPESEYRLPVFADVKTPATQR